jgi:molybdopterin molybdotransferase
VLAPQDIGALAAVGKTEVPVRRRLRVGVISTGDELVPAEQTPGPGQMRDVNGPMLAAALEEYGAACVAFGIAADDEKPLREKT